MICRGSFSSTCTINCSISSIKTLRTKLCTNFFFNKVNSRITTKVTVWLVPTSVFPSKNSSFFFSLSPLLSLTSSFSELCWASSCCQMWIKIRIIFQNEWKRFKNFIYLYNYKQGIINIRFSELVDILLFICFKAHLSCMNENNKLSFLWKFLVA